METVTHLGATLGTSVCDLLDVVDELRRLGLQQDLPIPQIAVCGDQSSGKSSVLEALSGVAFPRGSGLVTRCATELSMTTGAEWSATVSADGLETKQAQQPHEVGELISGFTDEMCVESGFCIDKTIRVRLVGPQYTNLTLVDLPGIVRTVTEGQSPDVIEQVGGLVDRYIKQPRTIILAVIPCNQDIATVDIVERASKVDPSGLRTVGVLTKPDLVDRGAESNTLNVLANRTKPLRHGYYMVKNRSQQDLTEQVTLEEARQREKEWFRDSHFQKNAATESRLGVESLQDALSTLLVDHIRSTLPQLVTEASTLRSSCETELSELGKAPPTSKGERLRLVTDVIHQWKDEMMATCMGHVLVDDGAAALQDTVVRSEARLRQRFVAHMHESKPDFDGKRDSYNVEVVKEGYLDHAFYVLKSELESKDKVLHFVPSKNTWWISGAKNLGQARGHWYAQASSPLACVSTCEKQFWCRGSNLWGTSENFLHFQPGRDEETSCEYMDVSVNFRPDNAYSDLQGRYVKHQPPVMSLSPLRAKKLCVGNLLEHVQLTDVPGTIGSCVEMKCGAVVKVTKKVDNFRASLAVQADQCRGRELPGFLNFGVFAAQVRSFVRLWKPLSMNFASHSYETVRKASAAIVKSLSSTTPTLARVINELIEEQLSEANVVLQNNLCERIEIELDPDTENHYLYDTLNKIRNAKMTKMVADMPSSDDGKFVSKEAVLKLLQSAVGGQSNRNQELDDLIAYLKAYWKLATKRFIDNVVKTVRYGLMSQKRISEIEGVVRQSILEADDSECRTWFAQPKFVEARRRTLTTTLERLSAADTALRRLR